MFIAYEVSFRSGIPELEVLLEILSDKTALSLYSYEWISHFDYHHSMSPGMPSTGYQDAYKGFLRQQENDKNFRMIDIGCANLQVEETIFFDYKNNRCEIHKCHLGAEYLLCTILSVWNSLGGKFNFNRTIPEWADKPWNSVEDATSTYHQW